MNLQVCFYIFIKSLYILLYIIGDFYYCTCRDDKEKICSNEIKINSDTESASDTGKISNYNYNPKVFCSKCGNGYREESMLIEHMKIHETHCR